MDIQPKHQAILKQILKKHLSMHSKIWVFGSRATKAKKTYSDLDLAIDSGKHLDFLTLAALQHELSESELPYKVDIVDWQGMEKSFQNKISSELVLFLEL